MISRACRCAARASTPSAQGRIRAASAQGMVRASQTAPVALGAVVRADVLLAFGWAVPSFSGAQPAQCRCVMCAFVCVQRLARTWAMTTIIERTIHPGAAAAFAATVAIAVESLVPPFVQLCARWTTGCAQSSRSCRKCASGRSKVLLPRRGVDGAARLRINRIISRPARSGSGIGALRSSVDAIVLPLRNGLANHTLRTSFREVGLLLQIRSPRTGITRMTRRRALPKRA